MKKRFDRSPRRGQRHLLIQVPEKAALLPKTSSSFEGFTNTSIFESKRIADPLPFLYERCKPEGFLQTFDGCVI